MSRPVIGITAPNKRWHIPYFLIRFSVWVCGGRPLALKTPESVENRNVDGLVIGGGTDVFPGLFQNDPKQNYFYDHDRDEMEIGWLKRAEKEDIPVLGICRGTQMMNVMNGGSLHMDVSLAYEKAHYPKSVLRKMFFRKAINLEPDSLLCRVMRMTRARVNSMHSQSINRLGKRLRVVAQEDNGVVQGIERPGHKYYLGVQFHPEFLIYRPSMRRIFKGLIAAAKQT